MQFIYSNLEVNLVKTYYQVYLLKDKHRLGSAKLLDYCGGKIVEELNDQGITLLC